MKDVIIVEPCSSGANVFSFSSYLPLLGTLYIGTILKENGFNVKILNENILKRELIKDDLKADFLLLSCLTPTITRGYEIAGIFRKNNPNGKIIMGGSHVSFLKEEAAPHADHIVVGEAENVIVDLLKNGSTEKLVYGAPVMDLDTLPFIDWSLLVGNERGSILPIMTSRGCPFACNFCSVTEMFGRKYRAMSAERVIEEVKRASKRYIFFYDDNFTADTRRAHKIMDGLIDLKLKPKTWTAQVRSDVCKDPLLVAKMHRAGCERVYIGFESINLDTLKNLKKSQTPEDIAHAVNVLHLNKIKVHGMFMYGSDTDNKRVAEETVKFVKKHSIDSVQYMVLTPFPGTELFQKMESAGRMIHNDWKYFDGLHVVFWPENFTPIALQELAMDSFTHFYSLGGAANEIINLFADHAISAAYWMADKSRVHTHSFKNALFKAGGKLVLNRWNKINKPYMSYLYSISHSYKA